MEPSNESFFQLNFNVLETNLINILILLGILIYAYETAFKKNLEQRQKDLVQLFETAEQDVLIASNCYASLETSFSQLLLWLDSSKNLAEQEKKENIEKNYKNAQNLFRENFQTNQKILENLEKKILFSLQFTFLFITVSKLIKKFFLLSEEDQSKLLKQSLLKLEEN
jgi:F-type H+-transporting ATPase subunit b